MYRDRTKFYKEIEEILGCKLLVYITGDRWGLETLCAFGCYWPRSQDIAFSLYVRRSDSCGLEYSKSYPPILRRI